MTSRSSVADSLASANVSFAPRLCQEASCALALHDSTPNSNKAQKSMRISIVLWASNLILGDSPDCIGAHLDLCQLAKLGRERYPVCTDVHPDRVRTEFF